MNPYTGFGGVLSVNYSLTKHTRWCISIWCNISPDITHGAAKSVQVLGQKKRWILMHGCYKHTTPTFTQQHSLPAFNNDDSQTTDCVLVNWNVFFHYCILDCLLNDCIFSHHTTATHGHLRTMWPLIGPSGPSLRSPSAWSPSWCAIPILVNGTFPSLTLPCFFKTHWWLHFMMSFMFQWGVIGWWIVRWTLF